MGSFSNYWETKILDHLFGKGVYTPPTIYVALSTADPGESGSGLDEPEGGGYARAATQASDWNSAAGGLIDNAAAIEFDAAAGDWGTVTHFALFDAATGGNLLAHGSLAQPKTVNAADRAQFPPGDLEVTLD
ncbi:MAG: hypothetical protein GX448_13515 [Planctomycetes bacterium]|nr:hypothetical protein [Planctomycetota bacterium]